MAVLAENMKTRMKFTNKMRLNSCFIFMASKVEFEYRAAWFPIGRAVLFEKKDWPKPVLKII